MKTVVCPLLSEGNETYLDSGNIVAGNPKIFAQVLQTIAPHLTPALKSQA